MAKAEESRFRDDLFVGRRGEMDISQALLSDVCAGNGGVLIVEGEPGIGKSRLVSEISRYAFDRKMMILAGRCHDGEAIPPHWPWVEILRTYSQSHEIPKGGEIDIEAAVQTLLARLKPGDPPVPFTGDMASRGFLLQDAVIRLLKGASDEAALLIVLEVIHNADTVSLNLLDMFAQSIEKEKIGIITTFRTARLSPESRLAVSVGEMEKLRNAQRIHLTGIARDDVKTLFYAAAGSDVTEKIFSAVYDHTDGNCLFVKELIRALMNEMGPDSTELLEIGEGVRLHSDSLVPLMAKRLSDLPEKSRRILETAALLGREFSLDKLSAVVRSEDPEDLPAALEMARRLAFIEYKQHENGRYSFMHALYQDALTLRMRPEDSARRRCTIGLALEEYYQKNADKHAVELARFLIKPETGREKERCYHYSLIAGEQAFAKSAVDDIQEFFFKVYVLRKYRKSENELVTIYESLTVAFAMMRQFADATRMFMHALDCHLDAGDVKKVLD